MFVRHNGKMMFLGQGRGGDAVTLCAQRNNPMFDFVPVVCTCALTYNCVELSQSNVTVEFSSRVKIAEPNSLFSSFSLVVKSSILLPSLVDSFKPLTRHRIPAAVFTAVMSQIPPVCHYSKVRS